MNPQLNGGNPYKAQAEKVLETTFRLPEINNQDAAQKLESCIYMLPETDNVIKAASKLITRAAQTNKKMANKMLEHLQHHLASIFLATEAYILFGNEGNDKKKQRIIYFLQQSNNTARDIYNLALDCHLFITQNTNFQTLPCYATYLDSLEKIYNKLKEDLDSQTSTGWLKKAQRLSGEMSNLLNHLPRPVAPIAIVMAPDQNQAPEEEAYGADDSQNQGFEYQPPFIGSPGNGSSEESTSPALSSANDSQMSIAVGPVPQSTYATPDEELAGKWEYESDISTLSNPKYLGGGSFGTTYRMLLPNGKFCVVKLIENADDFIHEFTINMVLKAYAMDIIHKLQAGDFSEQNIFLFECLYHLVACYSNPQMEILPTTTPEEIKDFLEGSTDEFECTIGDNHGYALIFEYVEGTTLFDAAKSNPTMSFEVLQMRIKLLGQLCKALAFLDHAGIVHMDFKNDNMMITNQNTIKLLDLGIAFLRTNMILFENPLLERTYYSMAPEMLAAIAEATRARDEARAEAGVRDEEEEEEEIEINPEIFDVMADNFDKINIFPLWRIAFSILFWKDGLLEVDCNMVNRMAQSNEQKGRDTWDIHTAIELHQEFTSDIEKKLNELNTKSHITLDGNFPFFHIKNDPRFDLDTINRLLELLVRISVDNPEERMSAVDAFKFIQNEILPNMIPYQIPEGNEEEEEAKSAA